MEWSDSAIILNARPHGERAAVVSVLSAGHGRWQGRVNAAQSGARKAWLSAGTVVQATWRARLEDQLGSLVLEPTHHTSAHVFDDAAALLALEYMATLTHDITPERLPLPMVFEALHGAISQLCCSRESGNLVLMPQSQTSNGIPAFVGMTIESVIEFERKILDAMGYGLDVSRCAVTGTRENLMHISPNTGRAVCAVEAAPYADKLLPMPWYWLHQRPPLPSGEVDARSAAGEGGCVNFPSPSLRSTSPDGRGGPPSITELHQAAAITGHFLTQHFYMPPKGLPLQRGQLLDT